MLGDQFSKFMKTNGSTNFGSESDQERAAEVQMLSQWRSRMEAQQQESSRNSETDRPIFATHIKERLMQRYVANAEEYIQRREEELTTASSYPRQVVPTLDKLPCITGGASECFLPWGSEPLTDPYADELFRSPPWPVPERPDNEGEDDSDCIEDALGNEPWLRQLLSEPEPAPPILTVVSRSEEFHSSNILIDGVPADFTELDYIRYITSSNASPKTLIRVAEGEATPPYVLAQMAFHNDVDVRCAIAGNKRTPIEALWLLVRDESLTVRSALADNAQISIDVLRFLSRDENGYVAMRAQDTLSRLRAGKLLRLDFSNTASVRRASNQ